MLLGLDMLKRHQCCIDLRANCLKVGTTNSSTAFLAEAELPRNMKLNGNREEKPAHTSANPAAGMVPGMSYRTVNNRTIDSFQF